MNSGEFQAHTEKLEQLLHQVEALSDETARNTALELMQSLMDLHGASMSRLVEVLSKSGEAGRNALSKVAEDPLICGLLVLYGVHPLSLEDRVSRALEKLQPQIQRHGAAAAIVSCVEGVVRIRAEISERAHDLTELRTNLEHAVREAAPEVADVVIQGISPSGFIPLSMIQPAMTKEKEYEKSTA